jgi:hypothetical protein
MAANQAQATAQTRALPLVVADSLEKTPSQRAKAAQHANKFNELLGLKLGGCA